MTEAPFDSGIDPLADGNDATYVRMPTGFGVMGVVPEDDAAFDAYCAARVAVNDACEADPLLAARIAVLLNRAHALGAASRTAVAA